MKRLITKLICITIAILSLSFCTTNDKCMDVEYHQPISISPNVLYCLPDDSEFTVTEFENQLCPCNVTCVHPGTIYITIDWINENNKTTFTLSSDQQLQNDPLPNNINIEVISVELIESCTAANPNPEVKNAEILISPN